jgi:hypothetical protein
MSKKLIAIASAAALGLSALVAVPATALNVVVGAQATSASITVTGTVARGTTGTGTVADPIKITVPDAGTVAAADILTFTISSTIKRTAVTATVTEGIKLLDAPGDTTNGYTSASGSANLPATAATNENGAYVFYGFPTSTKAGLLTVTIGTDITQIYIQGLEGAAYDIKSVTIPTIEPKGKGVVTAVVTDAFGNPVVSTAGTLTLSRVGGTGGSVSADVKYSTTTKRWEVEITGPDAAGQAAYAAVVAGLTASTAQIKAFGEPETFFGLTTFESTAAKVATLTAQVAALTAQLAESRPKATSVTKKKYNTLARKWNAAFPSQRVALKK